MASDRYTGRHTRIKPRKQRNRVKDISISVIVATVMVSAALYGSGFFNGPRAAANADYLPPPEVIAAGSAPVPGPIICPAGEVQTGDNCETWPATTTPTQTLVKTTSAPVTTTPATTPAATPTPHPTTSTSKAAVVVTTTTSSTPTPTPSPAATVQVIHAYITGYSWFDNTPPGSASISYPVIHQTAGGTGTYADPITLAVGHSIINGQDIPDWPAGTKFYIPNLRRYFLVEDSCGDGNTPQNGPCHQGWPSGASTWFDVWVGGQGGNPGQANQCMDGITDIHTVIVNPVAGYPVVAGDIYSAAGCTKQYGDAIPTAL